MSIHLNKRKQILLFSKDALNSIDHSYLYFSELFKCVTNTSSLTSKERVKCMKMLRNSLVDRWKSCDDKPPAQTCSTRRETSVRIMNTGDRVSRETRCVQIESYLAARWRPLWQYSLPNLLPILQTHSTQTGAAGRLDTTEQSCSRHANPLIQ